MDCSAIQWDGHLWLKRKVQRKRGKARLCSVCTCHHFEKLREWGFIIWSTFLITHGAISPNVYTGNIKRLIICNTLTPWCFGPLRPLVPFMTYAHSSVLFTICLFGLYPLTFTSSKSLFASFSHHDPAPPLSSLQLTSKKCLNHLCLIRCNHMTHPHQHSWFNICYQIRDLIKFSYGLLLNLITPWSVTGHFIFLKIFLSHVFNILLIK